MSHTPGPWRVGTAAEGVGISITSDAGVVAFVRDAQHPLTRLDQHTASANARLIASAPALAAALAKLCHENPWERIPPGDGLCQTDEPWACYACGAEIDYESRAKPKTDPTWWDIDPRPTDGVHLPDCVWVQARSALAAARGTR